jgi:hypothetical protein
LNSFLYYTKKKNEFEEALKLEKLREEVNDNRKLSTYNSIEAPKLDKKKSVRLNSEDYDDQTDLLDSDEHIKVSRTFKEELKPNKTAFQKFNKNEQDIIIDKGIAKTVIVSQGLQLILIDDHANTYYPFISFVVQDLVITDENINHNQKVINSTTTIKVLTYNFIAGIWEPLIEKSSIIIEVVKDMADEKVHCTTININFPLPVNKPNAAFNINISDLSISFLYSTMNSWIDKYFKLKNNYAEEVKKLIQNDKNMNITNHTVYNFTGRPMRLYKLFKNNKMNFSDDVKKLGDIAESNYNILIIRPIL